MIFAWQGWQLEIPEDWSPVKLEGTYESGYALFSDIHRPRVGFRWATPGKRFDPQLWAREALVGEVGQLAADEAQACESNDEQTMLQDGLLYSEAAPPGRDVWVATSRITGRTIQLVHHVYADELSHMDQLQQSFAEAEKDDESGWSVFDLSCRTMAGWRLESQRLNAGDLNLQFASESDRLAIRWIALAHLALTRMSLDRWLEQQIRPRLKAYVMDESTPFTTELSDGRHVSGLSCRLRRKRLAMWNAGLPSSITHVAVHDPRRDRLIFIEGYDSEAVTQLAHSIGWAAAKGALQTVVR